jgi:predicted phosphoribosyltransferase
MKTFVDRTDGGRQLADALRRYAGRSDTMVLALPRGGVPVGYEVAHALDLPMDVFLVRKLGVPGQEELAMGAIAPGDVLVLNPDVVMALRIPAHAIDAAAARERPELERRQREYRDARPEPDLRGCTVILVDDGLATGSTMRAAVAAARRKGAARIVVAVPVASPEAAGEFRLEVDDFVCLMTPEWFAAVGEWYEDFSQTTDEEVRELLARAQREHAGHV